MTEPESQTEGAPPPFRAGFAALLGKPNAGKSTLLNRIAGTKLAAVSPLPQTTRYRFSGIYTDERRQIIFVDLPGMIGPTDRLNECLRDEVLRAVADVDIVIHLVDVEDPEPLNDDVAQALGRIRSGVVLAVNKIDGRHQRVDAGSWAGERMTPEQRRVYTKVLGLSARDGSGVAGLIETVAAYLPESPPLYDPDQASDRDMRYIVQEMIREKLYLNLHEELPYATAVEIDEFTEREGAKLYIQATIHVERESQKGIVIGKGGQVLKKISTEARRDIESVCDAPVFLELRVKVRPKWRTRDGDLRRFGLEPPRK